MPRQPWANGLKPAEVKDGWNGVASMNETTLDLVRRYNYADFTPENFEPWMRFAESPAAGETGADFPLWCAETGSESSLAKLWAEPQYLVVEFGSFT